MTLRTILLALFTLCPCTLYSQGYREKVTVQRFYDFITGDSVQMYFNAVYIYTPPQCGAYTRFATLQRTGHLGHFNGPFIDRNGRNQIIGKGRYINGVKDGDFELYYNNGRPQLKAKYTAGRPVGLWNYFHKNGKLERTLMFTESDTLLITLADSTGRVVVRDGNGNFEGQVAGLQGSSGTLIAKGNIKNGKQDGLWTSSYNERPYCNESFASGKLINGTYVNLKFPDYKKSLLTLILPNYLRFLEQFEVTPCAAPRKYISTQKDYSFNQKKFNSDLEEQIHSQISQALNSDNTKATDYAVGVHVLTMQFTVNYQGKPDNIAQETDWGSSLFPLVKQALESNTKFPPRTQPLFFHLKLTVNDDHTLNSDLLFSYDPYSGT